MAQIQMYSFLSGFSRILQTWGKLFIADTVADLFLKGGYWFHSFLTVKHHNNSFKPSRKSINICNHRYHMHVLSMV